MPGFRVHEAKGGSPVLERKGGRWDRPGQTGRVLRSGALCACVCGIDCGDWMDGMGPIIVEGLCLICDRGGRVIGGSILLIHAAGSVRRPSRDAFDVNSPGGSRAIQGGGNAREDKRTRSK